MIKTLIYAAIAVGGTYYAYNYFMNAPKLPNNQLNRGNVNQHKLNENL